MQYNIFLENVKMSQIKIWGTSAWCSYTYFAYILGDIYIHVLDQKTVAYISIYIFLSPSPYCSK